MRSVKAVFQLPPQNRLRDVAAAGDCMSGRALMPRARHRSESKWKTPK